MSNPTARSGGVGSGKILCAALFPYRIGNISVGQGVGVVEIFEETIEGVAVGVAGQVGRLVKLDSDFAARGKEDRSWRAVAECL